MAIAPLTIPSFASSDKYSITSLLGWDKETEVGNEEKLLEATEQHRQNFPRISRLP